jgi:hypothetical protein
MSCKIKLVACEVSLPGSSRSRADESAKTVGFLGGDRIELIERG